jgi:phosphatidate cytidylyltransferase
VKNFIVRTVTGVLFIFLVGWSIYSGPWHYTVIFSVFNFIALLEYYRLVNKEGGRKLVIEGLLVGVSLLPIVAMILTNNAGPEILAYILPLIFLTFILEIYRNKPDPIKQISTSILGPILISLPFTLLLYTSFLGGQYDAKLLLGFFILLWTNDTGAYLVGMSFGKRRLFERISPKKSWEGFWGGFILSLIAAWFYGNWADSISKTDWMVLAVIIVVFGTFGDLSESLFKRSVNVKDSGSFLPGHGGIMDRFDGMFLAAPMIATYLTIRMM